MDSISNNGGANPGTNDRSVAAANQSMTAGNNSTGFPSSATYNSAAPSPQQVVAANQANACAPAENQIQRLIDGKQYQSAIDTAIKAYGIDTNGAKSIKYDKGPLPNNADADTNGNNEVRIGPNAFKSPGVLASTIVHEMVHVKQNEEKGPINPNGKTPEQVSAEHARREVEAYRWEKDNADRFCLTADEKARIETQIDYWRGGGLRPNQG